MVSGCYNGQGRVKPKTNKACALGLTLEKGLTKISAYKIYPTQSKSTENRRQPQGFNLSSTSKLFLPLNGKRWKLWFSLDYYRWFCLLTFYKFFYSLALLIRKNTSLYKLFYSPSLAFAKIWNIKVVEWIWVLEFQIGKVFFSAILNWNSLKVFFPILSVFFVYCLILQFFFFQKNCRHINLKCWIIWIVQQG